MLPGSSLPRVVGAILVAALTIGCGGRPEPVGVGAALSTPFIDATRMAIDQELAQGTLPPLDTVLRYEWSNRAALALELVDTFRLRPHLVGVVAHSNSSASLATAPLYNQLQVVQIAPTSTASAYTDAGPFSYRLAPADPEQGRILAAAIDTLFAQGARVAVLYVNDDYGRGLRAAVLGHLDTLRHPVVYQQPHTDEEVVSPPPDREQRVRATIAALVDQRPDVVLWLGRPATFELYLRVLREVAGPIPVLGGDALSNWRDRDRGNGDWDGVRYTDFLDLDATEALRDFRRRYEERFQRTVSTSEVLSYDAMHLLLAAIRDGARTGPEVQRWLDALGRDRPPHEGLSGPISFDANGDIARSYVLITVSAPARPPR